MSTYENNKTENVQNHVQMCFFEGGNRAGGKSMYGLRTNKCNKMIKKI